MHGNVWEWCHDGVRNELNIEFRIPCGGCWAARGGSTWSARDRQLLPTIFQDNGHGLRLARVPVGLSVKVLSEPKSTDRNYQAAQWVLSKGECASIIVAENGEEREMRELPAGPFELIGVNFQHNQIITDVSLSALKDFKNLKLLQLGYTGIGDDGVTNFNGIKSLKHLYLPHRVTDAGLANFEDSRDLHTLSLHGLRLSNSGLAYFSHCTQLVELSLRSSPLSNVTLSHFKDCKLLEGLDLADTGVNAAELVHFKDSLKLKSINLSVTPVGDSEIELIKNWTKLEQLWLVKTRFTAAGIEQLKKALPNCRIEWDGQLTDLPMIDADRTAAKWILSHGGRLQSSPGGNINSFDQLPTHRFDLISVSSEGLKFKDETDLKCLANLPHLQHAYFGGVPITGVALGYFASCSELVTLHLGSTALRANELAVLKNLKQLQNLSLHNTRMTDSAIDHILHCPRLSQLDLSLTSITDEALDKLRALKDLELLQVYQTKVTAQGVKKFSEALPKCRIRWEGGFMKAGTVLKSDIALAQSDHEADRKAAEWVISKGGTAGPVPGWFAKDLKNLPNEPFVLEQALLGSTSITDADLTQLSPLKSVKHLALFNTQVSDAGLVHLKDLKSVTHLNLNDTKVTGPGLSHLVGMNNLVWFQMFNTQVGDEGLVHLKGLTSLAELGLDNTKVGNAGLAHLKELKNLKKLFVGNTRVNDDGLQHIFELKSLSELTLYNTAVSNRGMATVGKMKGFTNLNLGRTAISDEGVEKLRDLTNLKRLDLHQTSISDAGLAHLESLKALEWLNVNQTKVTAVGLARFRAALPGCKVESNFAIDQPK